MKSRSKYQIDENIVIKLFENAGIPSVENVKPLGAGEFNSVYAADADGKAYVLKIAPKNQQNVLTYEQNMMEQEVYYYGMMEQAGINVPNVYFSDFSKNIIPTEYFIMERLDGKQLNESDLNDAERKIAQQKLAEMMALMHVVKGEKYGYRQNGQHKNWYLAIKDMVSNLVLDAKRYGRKNKNGAKLLDYIEKNKSILERVECSLINFDIWEANIFVCKKESGFDLYWIDPERCLWGDRIADFVCMEFMNMTLDAKQKTIENYNKATEKPIDITDEVRIRFAVMLGYLGMIMEVEKYARYSLFHYGYWRNVTVCKMLFENSFKTLDNLTN